MNLRKSLAKGKLVTVQFPDDQYIKEKYEKKQIVWHHTAGWDNARGMFEWWESNQQRVATCIGIEDDGKVYKGFDSSYYGWHVNVASRENKLPEHLIQYKRPVWSIPIERHSVGLEICNWGGLVMDREGKFHTWASTPSKPITVDDSKVIYYPDGFRGFNYYERYTIPEIESAYSVTSYWARLYGIPTAYNPDMWEVSERALNGSPGIWTHAAYRTDKSDCHPQPELIEALKAL